MKNKAKDHDQRIRDNTILNIKKYLGASPLLIIDRIRVLEKEWSAARMFHFLMSLLTLIFLFLTFLADLIFGVFALALTAFHTATILFDLNVADFFRRGFNFRRRKEIDDEILALRFMKDDFKNISKDDIENLYQQITRRNN